MPFAAARVLSFESRRAKEIAELIRTNGGVPFVAPALIEVPLEQNEQAFAFAADLYDGRFDMLIFLTGVGARLLARILATREAEERFLEALRRLTVVVRGPKPAAVLREWQVPVAVSVPEPNTWRELLEAIVLRPEKNVAVQEYGRVNQELIDGLQAQGRTVTRISVYQWKLPEDTGPLTEAVEGLLAGRFDTALFTTGIQIEHLLDFAELQGRREAVLEALRKVFIGSIGPTCTEALRASGLTPAMEPSHPRMGILVREAALQFATERKRSRSLEVS